MGVQLRAVCVRRRRRLLNTDGGGGDGGAGSLFNLRGFSSVLLSNGERDGARGDNASRNEEAREEENGQHDSESGSVCRYINANVSSL